MTDPFQSASGAVATATPAGDPFAQPASSSFPKIDQMDGRLLLIRPTKIETVAKPEKFGGKPGETQERITADLIVLDGGELMGEEAPHRYTDMFISQQSLVGVLKGALNKRTSTLGRLFKFPVKADLGTYPTRQALAEAIAAWRVEIAAGRNATEPRFTWKLEEFTPADADVAREYLKSNPL